MTLWSGRFAETTAAQMEQLNTSLGFDRRLYDEDITGSIAWARGLGRAGVLTEGETHEIVTGLETVRQEFATGTFAFRRTDEDIHTAVERRLTEIIGPLGGKLHTGRSRNDQVATDLRLYLLKTIDILHQQIAALQSALLDQAEAHVDVLMPGYTHLQQAQPILFSHWLGSFFWKFQRDRERLHDVARRAAALPLGAGALAGCPLPIDRQTLAAELGFASVAPNSLDAVADRDYVVEFLACAALLQVHLSNLAEDLIIWSSHEFGFIELDDAYATGSSLMPQKKNPDSLELLRGKSGRLAGALISLLTTLKGLPSSYNKDLQEDKEPLFDAIDTLALELPVAAGVIRTLRVNAERMQAALQDALLATDLADYLVRKGIPFRQSHHLVGRAIRQAEAAGLSLKQLDLASYQAIDPAFAADLYAVLDFRCSVQARAAEGGTAPVAVRAQLLQAREVLARGP